jgi:hypothetical protein
MTIFYVENTDPKVGHHKIFVGESAKCVFVHFLPL